MAFEFGDRLAEFRAFVVGKVGVSVDATQEGDDRKRCDLLWNLVTGLLVTIGAGFLAQDEERSEGYQQRESSDCGSP